MIGAHRNVYIPTQDEQAIFDRYEFFLQYPKTSSIPTFFEVNNKLIDPDFRDKNGKNAFLLACETGSFDVLNYIKSVSPNSINTEARDSNGNYALHSVVVSGRPELVKWLASSDSRFLSQSCRNLDGLTAAQLAVKLDKKGMAKTIDAAFKSMYPFRGARATGPRAKL